jgi:hypothetical protein
MEKSTRQSGDTAADWKCQPVICWPFRRCVHVMVADRLGYLCVRAALNQASVHAHRHLFHGLRILCHLCNRARADGRLSAHAMMIGHVDWLNDRLVYSYLLPNFCWSDFVAECHGWCKCWLFASVSGRRTIVYFRHFALTVKRGNAETHFPPPNRCWKRPRSSTTHTQWLIDL